MSLVAFRTPTGNDLCRWRCSVRKRSPPSVRKDLRSANLSPRIRPQPRFDAGNARLEGGVIAKAFRFKRPICPTDFEDVLARLVVESRFHSHGFVAARKEPDH